ncbi:hypothetical protein [Paenibacillus sp. WLX2291]|uniref:hypothetical protein n=1 Tax=Paenibacillus sp. WLX2291 TaxID=3296934 RepID=UPI0039841F27
MKMKLILAMLITLIIFPTSASFAATTEYSNNLIPQMTSNTAPSGVASANEEYSSLYAAYKAFNRSTSQSYEDTWEPRTSTGWLSYQFPEPVAISKYTIKGITPRLAENIDRAPKVWNFEAYDEQNNKWIVLDHRENETTWLAGEKREFTFANTEKFSKYRINVTQNNGGIYVSIDELEMMSAVPASEPEPTPTPTPEPENGNRAILVITMITGLEKEFDLSMTEVNDFISWYEAKQAGTGKASYAIDKHDNNKGPFSSRKDYVIFDKILTFEVSEYSN